MVGMEGSMDYLGALAWPFQLVVDHRSRPG